MTKAKHSAANSNVKKELKRDGFFVLVFLLVVGLAVSWKLWIMPELTTAFANSPDLNEVNNLLMIVGWLVIVCLLLVTVLCGVIWKIRSLSAKLDSWDLLIVRQDTPTQKNETETTAEAGEENEDAGTPTGSEVVKDEESKEEGQKNGDASSDLRS